MQNFAVLLVLFLVTNDNPIPIVIFRDLSVNFRLTGNGQWSGPCKIGKIPEYKCLVEDRIQVLPVNLRLELLFPIRKQMEFDVWVATAGDVLHGEVSRFEHFHDEAFNLDVVSESEVQFSRVL